MSVLRRPPAKEAVEARIRVAIVGLRPLLHIEPAGLELIEFDPQSGLAMLRVAGDCPDCDMPAVTLLKGIEAHLMQRIPELRGVRCVSPS
ncbi:MAG TPA: NifU family protein [Gemmatimonadaceae bacterium]|jgi:Fe-S cluster biogenesis protein NfuA|nr:NifU family protein [Gemmatimonadaceae bacterium]